MTEHLSDCAGHNAPAYPVAPCDCGHDDAVQLARQFHDKYERLALQFGYETRPDTREFDPASANGRLMTAVCAEILAESMADAAKWRDIYNKVSAMLCEERHPCK